MPEGDFEEKNEQATPRRREEAREKGQVAKSHDLCAALTLLGSLIILQFSGESMLESLALLTRKSLDSLATGAITQDSVRAYYGYASTFLLTAAAPLLLGVLAVGIAANLVQSGFIWTAVPLTPDIGRLDPFRGLSSLLSKKGFVRLVVSLFKVVVIGAVAYVTIKADLPSAAATIGLSPSKIVVFGAALVMKLGYRVAIALLILALFDYGFQRWQYERDLMMSKQELKEELKRMEGDPLTRERRRRMQRHLAMQRMMANVPKADVVVTNPTELAIALQYDPDKMSAPTCVAKGAGFIAAKIREIAAAGRVPIVENKIVARLLYKRVEVGAEIPIELYQAVAEILAYVYKLKGKTLAEAAG
jgi:flagellar biosynthetic protein FlhB